jgi:apolipoprotein N-acyltransferase
VKNLLFAFLAGSASATGFAPLGLWPLTLIAFALLMTLTLNVARMRTAYATGYAFGLGYFGVGLNWIAASFTYQAAMPAWLGWLAVAIAAFYLAIFPGLATALAWRVGKGMPVTFVLLFAASWILTEILRATFLFSFAWNPLAAIAAGNMESSGMIGATAFIGTYGLSGVFILASGAIFLLFKNRPAGAALTAAAPVLAAITSFLLAGPEPPAAISGTGDDPNRPIIRVIQPNIDQSQKWEPEFAAQNFERLVNTTGETGDAPRLIFWPEAAVPDYIEHDPLARFRIAALLGSEDTLLLGATRLIIEEDDGGQRRLVGARNSLYAMNAEGELLARYDKANLVHFGEYLPFRGLFEAVGMSRLAPGDLDFWPGPGPRTLTLPGFGTVGGQICYEIIFSGQVIDRSNRPDFIFNPSNDAWFGAWGPPQHLAQARLRAAEEGVPVIRSTPTGISAVIDADGRVTEHIPYLQAGTIDARLPRAHAQTIFSRHGNIIPLGLALLLAGLAIALMRRAR